MSKPEISVIVPMYNSAACLSETLYALRQQTLDSFEVLLCDDGSTDETVSLCPTVLNGDPRFRLLSLSHSGVSGARNQGLKQALGRYIAFCDSDDRPDPDWLSSLEKTMVPGGLSICGYRCVDGQGNTVYDSAHLDNGPVENTTIAAEQFLVDLFSNRHMYQGYIWNKLFDREILDRYDIRFTEGIAFNEDRLFLSAYLHHCGHIAYSNIPKYSYYLAVSPRTAYRESYFSEISAFEAMKPSLLEAGNEAAYYYLCVDERRAVQELLELLKQNDPSDFRSARTDLHRILADLEQYLAPTAFCTREEFRALGMLHNGYENLSDAAWEIAYQDYLLCSQQTGAEAMDYFKYHFDRLGPAARGIFLTRREYAALCEKRNTADAIKAVEDKREFARVFEAFLGRDALPVPSKDWESRLSKMCQKHRELLFKPQKGGYGNGLRRFPTTDDRAVREITIALKEDGGLVEEFLSQDPVFASFHSESVNTVRSLTVLDHAGKPHLIAAALRTGMHHADCDNLGGGLFAPIDLATGTLSADATTHFGGTYPEHPDTGTAFCGTVLPHWDRFLEKSDAVALVLPGLALCCWDWALRDDGTWCLIEGNVKGGLGLLQEAEGRGLKGDVSKI